MTSASGEAEMDMRSTVSAIAIVGVFCAAFSTACGSGSTVLTPLTPTSVRCSVTLAPSSSTVESGGGTGVLKVTTARECQWSVAGAAGWMTFKSATAGQGPGEVTFNIEPNRSTEARQVELVVGDERFVISQKAATCSWKVAPDTVTVGSEGDEVRAVLTTEDFCSWTLTSRAPWIEVTSDDEGRGNSDIRLRVARNGGGERSGTVEFPSGTLRITQREAAPVPPVPAPVPVPPPGPPPPATTCTFDVTPAQFDSVAAGASEVSVDVKTAATCKWAASSSATWITVSPATGTGSAKVRLTIASNSGAKRTGSAVVAGRTVSVAQNTGIVPCTYSVTPGVLHFSSGSQTSQITVTTNKSTCSVKVASSASWLHVGSFPATGGGKVPLTVDANPNRTKRTATLTVTGDSFTQTVNADQDGR
jgi:hypothetical protein